MQERDKLDAGVRDLLANATPNQVDNQINSLRARLGGLPPEVELTVIAFEDGILSPADTIGYLVLYGIAYNQSAHESGQT